MADKPIYIHLLKSGAEVTLFELLDSIDRPPLLHIDAVPITTSVISIGGSIGGIQYPHAFMCTSDYGPKPFAVHIPLDCKAHRSSVRDDTFIAYERGDELQLNAWILRFAPI